LKPPRRPFVITSITWRISPEPPCSPMGFISTSGNGEKDVSDATNAETRPKPLPNIESPDGIKELMERARDGDKAMQPLVRKLFDKDEREGGSLLETYGDIYAQTRRVMTTLSVGNNLVAQEALRRKINDIRDDLAGPNPTALERILCERVALCWFDAHETDRRFVDHSDITFKAAEYQESRRDRAHKRFLAACKTLAKVRKLAVPAIQVNVANQQVNVAGKA
jgi:hypothetical protein